MDLLNFMVIKLSEVILRYRIEQNANINRLTDLRKLFAFSD